MNQESSLAYSCGDLFVYVSVWFALLIIPNDCLFTMTKTHLIYLEKFSDPVNEAVSSMSREK